MDITLRSCVKIYYWQTDLQYCLCTISVPNFTYPDPVGQQPRPSDRKIQQIFATTKLLFCILQNSITVIYFTKVSYCTSLRNLKVSLPLHKFARPTCWYYWLQETEISQQRGVHLWYNFAWIQFFSFPRRVLFEWQCFGLYILLV